MVMLYALINTLAFVCISGLRNCGIYITYHDGYKNKTKMNPEMIAIYSPWSFIL